MKCSVAILFLSTLVGCTAKTPAPTQVNVTLTPATPDTHAVLQLSEANAYVFANLGQTAYADIVITNGGDATTTVDISMAGPDASAFMIDSSAQFDLPPGDFEVVEISFKVDDAPTDRTIDQWGSAQYRAALAISAGGLGGDVPIYGTVYVPPTTDTNSDTGWTETCVVTTYLDPFTPSGTMVPGFNESLRFDLDVECGDGGFVNLTELEFSLASSDNGATGWNKCGDGTGSVSTLASGSAWDISIIDALNRGVSISPYWGIYTPTWAGCDADGDGINDPLKIGIVQTGLSTPVLLPSGSYTFIVKTDTSQASAVGDDTLQLNLDWLYYTDAANSWFNSSDTPINGGTIVF